MAGSPWLLRHVLQQYSLDRWLISPKDFSPGPPPDEKTLNVPQDSANWFFPRDITYLGLSRQNATLDSGQIAPRFHYFQPLLPQQLSDIVALPLADLDS
jgi:hypothetical protein